MPTFSCDMSLPTFGLFLILLLAFYQANAKQFPTGRIIGGEEAEPGLAPYQASLQTIPGNHLCGGAIIAAQWILTVGHCVQGWPADRLRVAVGSNLYKEPGAVYYADAIYMHCNYNNPRYINDLALLHLNTSIAFNSQTQPIELPTQRIDPTADIEFLFTGWGSTELWGAATEKLQKIKLQHVARSSCAELLAQFDDVLVDIGHVCAMNGVNAGSCQSDSGGPLVHNGTLYGILGWSYPCAQGVPDIFANVLYYREWIKLVMNENGRCKNRVPN